MPWYQDAAKPLDQSFLEKAEAYQLTLTKPPGALGVLEDIAVLTGGNQDNGMHLAPGLLLARTIVAGMSAASAGEKGL